MDFKVHILLNDRETLKTWTEALSADGPSGLTCIEFGEKFVDFTSTGTVLLVEAAPGFMSYEKVLELIKRKNKATVILTCESGVLSNKDIAGLLISGADDFVDKKINPEVLLAKLKAHIRRLNGISAADYSLISGRNRDISVDKNKNVCRVKLAGTYKEVPLTDKEMKILCVLLSNEGKVIRKEDILTAVWEEKSAVVNSQIVDKYIQILRNKVKPHSQKIRTVYGVGYVYESGGKK